MGDSNEFNSIENAFHSIHIQECPCQLSLKEFNSHIPTEQDDENKTLLINSSILSSLDRTKYVKSHFLILALKFHPDKNDAEKNSTCTDLMHLINKSFFKVYNETKFPSDNEKTVAEQGNIYTYIDMNNISCTFNDCFSIYSQPALTHIWRKELKKHLQLPEHKLAQNKGFQYGNNDHSVYVTVFNNGTIHCQGIMALYFGTNILAKDVIDSVIENATSSAIKCHSSNRSAKFRQSYQLFDISLVHGNIRDKSGSPKSSPKKLSKPQNTHTIEPIGTTENSDVTPSSNLPTENTSQLTSCLQTINQTVGSEKEASTGCSHCSVLTDQIQMLRIELEKALTKISVLETSVTSIKSSTKNIESTVGGHIKSVINRVQNLESRQSSSDWSTIVSDLKNSNKQNIQNVSGTTQKPPNFGLSNKSQSFKHAKQFDPAKCMVIYGIEKPAKSDDELRRLVGKTLGTAIVERIIRTGERAPKYMVQFQNPEMVNEVMQKWSTSNLGSSKVRLPIKNNGIVQQVVGFAKDIPKDIIDGDINETISKCFPGAKGVRLTKNNKALKVVKITFVNEKQLNEAINNGLLFEDICLRVRVEKGNTDPVYTQCYNCWRFGHVGRHCLSKQTCKICSGDHKYQECTNEAKCRNCDKDHPADSWSACPKFASYKAKVLSRLDNIRNG